MKVQFIRTHDTQNPETDLTIIQADDNGHTLVIKVIGYGTSKYRWAVYSTEMDCHGHISDVFDATSIDGYWPGETTLGRAMVWAEETTFAHVVRDLINNQ